jgi:hypothetical protein
MLNRAHAASIKGHVACALTNYLAWCVCPECAVTPCPCYSAAEIQSPVACTRQVEGESGELMLAIEKQNNNADG